MRDQLGMQKNMCSLSAVLRAYRGGYKSGSKLAKMRVTVLTVSVYHSWNMGNIALFKDEKPDIAGITLQIKVITLRCNPLYSELGCLCFSNAFEVLAGIRDMPCVLVKCLWDLPRVYICGLDGAHMHRG